VKRLRYGTWSRLGGAVLMAGAILLVPGWPAPARAATTTARVSLLGQTPWVEKSGVFRLRLQLPAAIPSGDHLEVQAYTRLTNRTDFDGALEGTPEGFVWYSTGALGPSALPADPAGGVDVEIPVNQAMPAGSTIPTFNATVGSGVYPIQIGLYDRNGLPDGQPLTTFLVYAAGPPSTTSLPRLSVAVVLPFHASPTVTKNGQVGAPTASDASRLSALASQVNAATGVTVNLDITPQTLNALTVGSANDQATASTLASAVIGGPDAALPSPYVRVSISDMEASGLGGEVDQQLEAGAQTLARAFGTAPSDATWVVNGPIDATTVSRLAEAGATHLIVPDSDLTALPPSVTETTFARPTGLSVPGGPNLTVYGADTQITADFASREPPVLAANQLLAELAMIQLETPGITRGVVALPPPGWSEEPAFVSTLLNGLRGHPLLASVSVSSLFAGVPAAPIVRQLASSPTGSAGTIGSSSSTSSSTTAVSTTPTSAQAPTPSLSGSSGQIQAARRQVSAVSSILPSNKALAASLEQQVLVSESVDVTEGQRQALVGSVAKTSGLIFDQMSLPGSSSITLTSTKSQIPLTILLKRPLKAYVALQLSSPRLLFQPFDPPNGRCTVQTTFAREVCRLVLVSENTTLKIPVQTRSSGVFPLTVALMSPDGSVVLAHDQDTVRSTAISGVGIVVIVLAVVSLALWWVRDLRRGRRARRLVPAPAEPAADAGPDGAGDGAAPLIGDPVVDDFFTRPPPEYDQPGR
jgi:Family of unknown function (DUF6049)